MRGRALGFRNGCLFQNDVCVSLWGQQQELTDDEQAGKVAFVEDLKALKKRHTTPVRKAQRGQIQGKQEDMRASLVCARVWKVELWRGERRSLRFVV